MMDHLHVEKHKKNLHLCLNYICEQLSTSSPRLRAHEQYHTLAEHLIDCLGQASDQMTGLECRLMSEEWLPTSLYSGCSTLPLPEIRRTSVDRELNCYL